MCAFAVDAWQLSSTLCAEPSFNEVFPANCQALLEADSKDAELGKVRDALNYRQVILKDSSDLSVVANHAS